MKIRSAFVITSTVAALVFGASAQAVAQTPPPTSGPKPPAAPKVPADELKAGKAIGEAPDAAAQMLLTTAFMQKYPQSTLAHKIAVNVSLKIGDVTDHAQQLTLAQSFRTTFPNPAESDLIMPTIVLADIGLGKVDDAFKDAQDYLSRTEDLVLLVNLTLSGSEELKRRNTKNIGDTEKYGLKAIGIIESDHRPENVEEAQWAQLKAKSLAQLYQSIAVCAFMQKKPDDATARFAKALAINPKDPMTYVWMTTMTSPEYEALSAKYNATAAGPDRDKALEAAHASLDRLIDQYAHVVALSEGDAGMKPLRDFCLGELTKFYKSRHNDSTDGLQELINKYKIVGVPVF